MRISRNNRLIIHEIKVRHLAFWNDVAYTVSKEVGTNL